jgi:hypothetical protein
VIYIGLDEQDKGRSRDYEFQQHRVTLGQDPRCDVVIAMDEFIEVLAQSGAEIEVRVHAQGKIKSFDLSQDLELKLSGHRLRISSEMSQSIESSLKDWKLVFILTGLHLLHLLIQGKMISTQESFLSMLSLVLLFVGGIATSTLALGFVKKVITGQFQLLRSLELNLFWGFVGVVVSSVLSVIRISSPVAWQFQEVENFIYVVLTLLIFFKALHFLLEGRFERLLRWGFASLFILYLGFQIEAFWPASERDYRLFRPDPAPPLVQIFRPEPQSLEEFLKSPLE